MKQSFNKVELTMLRKATVRLGVGALMIVRFPLCWLWGCIRFGALVQNSDLGRVCVHDAGLNHLPNLLFR